MTQSEETQLALVQNDMIHVKKSVDEVKKDVGAIYDLVQSNYVTHEEFKPVRTIVYGAVGAILAAVLSALLALVVIG